MAGRNILLSLFALVVTSCGPSAGQDQSTLSAAEKGNLLRNPAGRFQMVSAKDGDGIYVLDTREGTVRYCSHYVEGGDAMCGKPAT